MKGIFCFILCSLSLSLFLPPPSLSPCALLVRPQDGLPLPGEDEVGDEGGRPHIRKDRFFRRASFHGSKCCRQALPALHFIDGFQNVLPAVRPAS